MNILFICTGNTCRSPMAEAIYNNLARKSFAQSAGFSLSGFPATKESIQVAKENGLDLEDHLSQILDQTLIHWSDLILCMTKDHKEAVNTYFPNANVYTLYDYALGIQKDIQDPYGCGLEVYRKTFRELEELIGYIVK